MKINPLPIHFYFRRSSTLMSFFLLAVAAFFFIASNFFTSSAESFLERSYRALASSTCFLIIALKSLSDIPTYFTDCRSLTMLMNFSVTLTLISSLCFSMTAIRFETSLMFKKSYCRNQPSRVSTILSERGFLCI